MKIGVLVATSNDREGNRKRPYSGIRAVAQQAERDGFDSIWLADHLMYRTAGETHGIWETWTILTALAEATERVEIGPLVACNSFRNPAILAKMATAADEVSDGRLILGVGAGWNEPEYQAFGLPFDHRVDRLEEALQILKPLLRDGRVDFAGRYYQARDCEDLPRGPRPDGPPLMVGGVGPRVLSLGARYADLWNSGYFGQPETMAESHAAFKAACDLVGRDPATIGLTAFIGVWFPDLPGPKPMFDGRPLVGSPEDIAAAMHGYAELGVDHIMFQIAPYIEPARERLAEALQLYRASVSPELHAST
jgi:alkanesulfonate monooxygenase SsuD/methylene tetrahydromethanopterin reductase-like flavin-dependent oxidoreductase (luciferase family)